MILFQIYLLQRRLVFDVASVLINYLEHGTLINILYICILSLF